MALPVVQDRCSGHCCRSFYLPFSPAQLSAMVAFDIAARNAAGAPDGRARWQDVPKEWEGRPLSRAHDIRQIHDMVRYLGWIENPAAVKSGRESRESSHRYTCTNLLPNGDCGIYESRPEMCRSYPYGRECAYADCTWASAAEETKGCRG